MGDRTFRFILPAVLPVVGGLAGSATAAAMAPELGGPLTVAAPAAALEFSQQPDPNEDRFLQPAPDPLPPEEGEDEPILPEDRIDADPAQPDDALDDDGEDAVSFSVQSILVEGSTVFDAEDFAPVVTPLEGQTVTLEELQQVADEITQLYLNEGYLTSRAVVVDQVVEDGIVRIQVVEGRVGEIQIEGTRRLNQGYVRDRIELGTTAPLRTDRLEDQLRLLRADPLIENVEASLRAGDELGESILVVRVVEANAILFNAQVDNYSPPSVGSERFGFDLGTRNLTGIGDTLAISFDRSTRGGSNVFETLYRAPVNPRDGTIQARITIDRNQVVQEPFDEFDIEGETERYEISYRQPIIRTPREELALSLGFAYRDGQTLAFDLIPLSPGADAEGVTRTSVFRLGQDYVRRDVQGAWALRSQFSIGVDLLDATTNDSGPDARFFSWLGQIQRVQRLGDDHLLIAQLDLQLSPDPLLSSEQFVIGGGQSLRGFRQNVRAGDNGVRFSLEDRITLVRNEAGVPTFQLAPFLDLGAVWNDADNVELPDQTFLAGVGLGVLWEMLPDLDLRLDFAVPLIDLDDRGVNAQDDGIYFSIRYEL